MTYTIFFLYAHNHNAEHEMNWQNGRSDFLLGHDDAFAMLLAAKHPSIKLLGISTIHGNASVKNCTANALSLLTAMGETAIPVYEGSQKPFMRPAVHAPDIHGELYHLVSQTSFFNIL